MGIDSSPWRGLKLSNLVMSFSRYIQAILENYQQRLKSYVTPETELARVKHLNAPVQKELYSDY